MDLIVEPDVSGHHGTVRAGDLIFPCALGRGGVRTVKHEGDDATPAGRFALRCILFRADRGAAPVSGLPVVALAPDDAWCDDPADAGYNRAVKLPYAGRVEQLWREDGLYDLIVVVGYNDDPVIANAGSAIFIHVRAPDGQPTAGCVALAGDDLRTVLRHVDRDSVLEIEVS
jgi:L,D-peptidoglycan transpeptidase YkuD (ErfK/YbiS/YcfS/YnhG family)